jgi:hypothetical protein
MDAPDFERAAQRILDEHVGAGEIRAVLSHALGGAIVDALRLAWNARGAADIATIELQLAQQMGATASGPYTKNLDRALRALDR